MKCDMKMMVKVGLGLAVLVAVAYATVPTAREWIAIASPFLFFFICPLMMLFMMKGIHSCHFDHETKIDDSAQGPMAKAANTGDYRRSLGSEKAL